LVGLVWRILALIDVDTQGKMSLNSTQRLFVKPYLSRLAHP